MARNDMALNRYQLSFDLRYCSNWTNDEGRTVKAKQGAVFRPSSFVKSRYDYFSAKILPNSFYVRQQIYLQSR